VRHAPVKDKIDLRPAVLVRKIKHELAVIKPHDLCASLSQCTQEEFLLFSDMRE